MHFRPEHDPRGNAAETAADDDGGPVEWTDNAVSNSFAWASYRLVPSWCQTPEHWTSRLTNYLFTDCPCCLLFRGIVVGAALMTLVFVLLATITLILVTWK